MPCASAGRREGGADRFEREQTAFFERVRETYLELAMRFPERYRVIDAGQPLAAVREQLHRTLDAFLQRP